MRSVRGSVEERLLTSGSVDKRGSVRCRCRPGRTSFAACRRRRSSTTEPRGLVTDRRFGDAGRRLAGTLVLSRTIRTRRASAFSNASTNGRASSKALSASDRRRWEEQFHKFLASRGRAPRTTSSRVVPGSDGVLDDSGLPVGRGAYGGWDDGDAALARTAWCATLHTQPEQ